MNEKEKRECQTVILGALLHDVGKFYQRGLEKGRGDHQHLGDECFEEYFAEGLSILLSQDEIEIIRSAINNHHGHSEFITIADCLSAGMERIERIKLEDEEHGDPTKERLQSVFENVSLGNNKETNEFTYPLKSLSLKRDELFPDKIPEQSLKEEYKGLCGDFVAEIKNIPTFSLHSYLNTLYSILQKYTWCIPSAAYKHEPDISLFDHLKTTAAIAGCLYHNKRSGNKAEKEFLLVAGDISGIQNFIYRIAKSQGMGGISKRLRGRSFYLLLLQEVIARYIIEKVGLFSTNILFCGGGRFELLLPNTEATHSILTNARQEINRWLFDEYGSELGIVIEWVETDGNGLGDYGSLLEQIDENLSTAKKRKFNTLFGESSFWHEKEETGIRICKVCSISKVEDDKKPCEWCKQHKEIGEKLPKMGYLIFASSDEKLGDSLFEIPFSQFGIVYIIPKETFLKDNWLKMDIQKINNLDNLKTGFRFIGNTASIAKEPFSLDD
ncbi:MAG: type III-A CRISPR-associated protein Cas10/Csm1, partial [Nitrospinota bacterium]